MEAIVHELMNSGIAVELIVPSLRDTCTDVGIRLRTYGKNLPRNKMILAGAPTFEEALENAVAKAEAGRWENLDWADRPWECGGGSPVRRFGL